MTVRCPQCRTVPSLSAAEIGHDGAMVRCARCGTRWLARTFADDPYAGGALIPISTAMTDVSDAVVLEDRPVRFRSPQPRSHARPAPKRGIDGRLKLLGLALGVVAGLLLFRAPIVSALPLGYLPAEAASLEFRQVRSETVHIGSNRTLFVEGEVVNRSGSRVDLPAIRITLKSPSGALVRSWLVEPTTTAVEAGRTVGFRSALADPPEGVTQVTLNLAVREGPALVPLE